MENTKFNKRNFIHRLLASPFILCILILAHFIFSLKRFWHYLKFGGEYINFEENEKPTIQEIYKTLKEIEHLKKVQIELNESL